MSKNKNKVVKITNNQENETALNLPVLTTTDSSKSFLDILTKGIIPYLIILVLSVLLYSNTFKHQFALDDDIVICKNEYVLQGISGIPSIFTKDLFDSFYKQMNTTAQLTGGRYRPLSVASFAIEQEFIGTRENATFPPSTWDTNNNGINDPEEDINGDGLFNDKDPRAKGFGLRHINNVVLYALSVAVLFLFLSSIVFKQNKLLALIISLLFLAHPIHTEVVANVKSRDEIFSLLFIFGSLFFAHQIEKNNGLKNVILTSLFFLLALLSKEYGATLLALIPISLYLFSNQKFEIKNYTKLFVALAITFIIYLFMRSQAGPLFAKSDLQETEILNSPYLLASATETLATKIYIFFKYLSILVFPITLCSDYGFNSIPYKNFTDLSVILSILILLVTIAFGLFFLKKKNWMAFAILFYLANIVLVTNLIFNVGATMGERLVFHSSVGFCMLLGYLLVWISTKLNKSYIAVLLFIPIFTFYSFKTYSRNEAWKNDITLAITDVEINPNSTALNGNASSRHIDLSELPENKPKEKDLLKKSIQYGIKATTIHPGFVNGFLNLGLAYAKLEQYDSAKICWDKAFKMYPSHPQKAVYYNLLAQTYYSKGYNFGAKQQWKEGIVFLQKAVEIDSTNSKYWYDIGGFAYNSQDFSTAKYAWTKAYIINPQDTNIQKVQAILR